MDQAPSLTGGHVTVAIVGLGYQGPGLLNMLGEQNLRPVVNGQRRYRRLG